MPIRILIIDDHRLLRAGLKTLLSSDPNLLVVGEAMSGEEALRAAQETNADVALMDMSLSGMDGLEATRKIKEIQSNLKILMLTMHEDNELMKECIRVGASGYIIKRANEAELIDAIYAVHRGIIYIHPSMMTSLVSAAGVPKQAENQHTESLSAREVEVLRYIVKGYSNRQIGDALNISIRTVETHRSNIMEKLDLHSRVDLVRYAAEHGLM